MLAAIRSLLIVMIRLFAFAAPLEVFAQQPLISSDARQVSPVVGYGLIVTGRDQTFIEDVKNLVEQLQGVQAKVIGTVLNRA